MLYLFWALIICNYYWSWSLQFLLLIQTSLFRLSTLRLRCQRVDQVGVVYLHQASVGQTCRCLETSITNQNCGFSSTGFRLINLSERRSIRLCSWTVGQLSNMSTDLWRLYTALHDLSELTSAIRKSKPSACLPESILTPLLGEILPLIGSSILSKILSFFSSRLCSRGF